MTMPADPCELKDDFHNTSWTFIVLLEKTTPQRLILTQLWRLKTGTHL